jgi:hypothetical protein
LVLAIAWLVSGKSGFGKLLGFFWLGVILFFVVLRIVSVFNTRMKVEKEDIYGEYVVARTKCPGKQADWQYNHYRLEIKTNQECFFYETEREKIIKTHHGKVLFIDGSTSPHIILDMDERVRHHIIENSPTLYREVWSFYYVFESPLWGNVFFKKSKWEPLEKHK